MARASSPLRYAELRQLEHLLARFGATQATTLEATSKLMDVAAMAAVAATEAQRHERRHCVWCLTPHYGEHPELCDGCRAARPNLKEAMT